MTSTLAHYRPADHPAVHRMGGDSLLARRQAREDRRRQKRIVIFCNGDIFFKGKKLSITPNRYVSYNDLLQDLTNRMPQYLYLPNGVRQLFSPSSGRRLSNVTDLRDGGAYVCAGNETFKPVKYGEAELTPWGKAGAHHDYGASYYAGGGGSSGQGSSSQFAGYNAFPPSKFLKRQQQQQHQELQLQQQQHQRPPDSNRFAALRGGPSGAGSEVSTTTAAAAGLATVRQPKVVTVVKEGPRPRQVVKILLNRRGVQSYQQLLADISDSFGASHRRGGRLRRLWTIGGREVRDVGDLFRDEELFVGSADDAIGLDRVADLLEELYPGNADVKSLLRHWERRLRRQEKRRGSRGRLPPAAAAAAAAHPHPHRVEERDSGYDESELAAAGTPTLATRRQQKQEDSQHSPLKGDRLKKALEARRHSKPLPLLHEPQQQPQQQQPVDEVEETGRQRRLEEQRLSEEAAAARKDKQKRLSRQRDTAGKQAGKDSQQQQQQQLKGHVVLPPIHQSAKEPQAATADKDKDKDKESGSSSSSKSKTDKQPHKKEGKKKKQQEQQQQQEVEEEQKKQTAESLPALPQLPPQPPQQQPLHQSHPPQQQQQHRRSVSPATEQRILSTVREEAVEKDETTTLAEKRKQPTAESTARKPEKEADEEKKAKKKTEATTKEEEEEQEAEKEEKLTPRKKTAERAVDEVKTPQKKQQKEQPGSAGKKAGASKKAAEQQQPAAAPPEETPQPLIRPISSTRYINERFDLGKTMGDGNFAIVRACVKKESKNEYAMKVIDKSKLRGKEHMVINEVRIMKLCQHPNIVRLLEEYETRTEIYLVMELVKGGDLFDAISQVVKFNEMQAAHMVADMASALFYLHSRNIVHRDLKPENLLVYRTKDSKISLKLGDFGLAMEVDKPIYTVCGTPTYVAPEILEERGYGLEVDLWALGVITYILLCGFPPFRSRDRRQTELFQFIKSGAFDFLSPYWDHISLSAKDLIQHLLIVDRRRRFTAVDVLCHPWVISLGGSKKMPANLPMKEQQAKLREQLAKQAADSMAEFQKVKANSIYGTGNAK